MTQIAKARAGNITPEMKAVAAKEQVAVEWLRDKVAAGRVAIPANKNHKGLIPCGIGEGLFIKVNANIGTSSDRADLEEELAKLACWIDLAVPFCGDYTEANSWSQEEQSWYTSQVKKQQRLADLERKE